MITSSFRPIQRVTHPSTVQIPSLYPFLLLLLFLYLTHRPGKPAREVITKQTETPRGHSLLVLRLCMIPTIFSRAPSSLLVSESEVLQRCFCHQNKRLPRPVETLNSSLGLGSAELQHVRIRYLKLFHFQHEPRVHANTPTAGSTFHHCSQRGDSDNVTQGSEVHLIFHSLLPLVGAGNH